MKKILLLTTIYPSPDLNLKNNTNVCHYFAKEWIRTGNEVKVIFNYPIYHRILHWIAKLFEKTIASMGSAYVTTNRISNDEEYVYEGVVVNRFPLYKIFPKTKVSNKNIQKQIAKIIASNEKDNFKPDIIIAHFFYPHLEMVSILKDYYHSKSAIVVHQQSLNLEKIYKENYKDLIQNIDAWGFRSVAIKSAFENKYGICQKSFICYSGVPSFFLNQKSTCSFSEPIRRFVYVGSFIKRKYPEAILYALIQSFEKPYDFNLSFIGDGKLEGKLKKITNKYKLTNNVSFHGYLPRKEIREILRDKECFIMISKNETFGLVYLEAMAMGCITIASKGEGMEGIIKNGINGFLCPAGDYDELSKIIKHINQLQPKERKKISDNAQQTAYTLNDQNVAELYLNNII